MKKYCLYFLICFIVSITLQARNLFENAPINAYTYLTVPAYTDSNEVLIAQGLRAFYLTSTAQLKPLLAQCELANKTKSELYFIVVPSNPSKYISVFKQTKLLPKLFLGSTQPYPTEKALVAEGKNYVLIELRNSKDKNKYPLKSQHINQLNRQTSNPSFLYACSVNDSVGLKTKLQKFWDLNAHPMNFVMIPANQFPVLEAIVQQSNQKQRITGMFLTDKLAFAHVEIQEHKLQYNSPYFCYPFKGYTINLTPYKEGYFFSPDAITSNYTMAYKFFKIQAHRLDKNYLRILKLNFDTPDSTLSIYNFLNEGVEIKETSKSKVANFSGSGSQISFLPQLQPDSLLNFSASFRIKLTSNERFQSILSMGKTFCLKIADGHPSFNVYVNTYYKDMKSKIDTSKYYHLAFVVSKGRVFKLYVNGKKTFQDSIQRIGATNEVMQIGNNSQYEPFNGQMDDIHLWNRTLSDDEIMELYSENEASSYSVNTNIFILLLSVLLVGSVGFILSKRKRVFKKNTPISYKIALPNIQPINAIFFFGRMRLYSRDGKDLSVDMSPKLKLLFIILCFETIEHENGINTKELTDILWPGMSEANAKNNRSPYIHKLRTLLAQMDGIELLFEGKNWKLKFSTSIWFDYFQYLHVMNTLTTQFNTQELVIKDDFIKSFSQIIGGNLLDKMEHEYIDSYRAKSSDKILQIINTLSEHYTISDDAQKLLMLADILFNLDELSEEGLALQLKAYRILNNQSMIRLTKENFNKKYQNSYNQPYIFDETE